MNCQEIDDRLDDYVDGALGAPAASDVEAHLRGCALCRDREQRLRQVLAHAAALPRSVAPPRDLWPEIARQLERERPWSWRSGGLRPVVLAAAATVVVALAAALWSGRAPEAVRTVAIQECKSYSQSSRLDLDCKKRASSPAFVILIQPRL